MRYGSVCSGIEAATQAWHPLGWRPSFFSEIEKFPRAVLQHHYPDVPLHGDFTTIEAGQYDPIDLLVGGTPCQSFSIAGLRGGLGDDRGNLALEYLRLADRLRPRWLVWENVPGVLSSNEGRDFGAILGGMVELGYGFAYRVLDAQFCRTHRFAGAVPQRRRRVFVVGHSMGWRRAAAVLFDRESMSGHPAPRREAGQRVAPTISARPSGGGGLGTDFDLDGGLIANSGDVGFRLTAFGGNNTAGPINVATACTAHSGRFDFGSETLIAFSAKDHGADATEGVAPTLRAMGHAGSHANGGGQMAVAFDMRGRDGGAQLEGPHDTANIRAASGGSSRSYVAFAENSRAELRLCGGDGQVAAQLTTGGGKPGQGFPAIADPWRVRRLMPVECERLQGFPDGYTDIPWRGKDHAPDGPRYKALGNSMAVNCMELIGQRIALVDGIAGE